MPMTTAQWSNTISLTEFEKPMREESSKKLWAYDEVFGDQSKTTEHEIKGYIWTAFGLPSPRDYGEDIRTEEMQEVGDWTITDTEIALGADIDDKLLEDMRHIGRKQFLNQMASGFGESYAQAKSLYAALIFNRAFVSTNQAMWDAGALCDDRPLLDGTTWANYIAAGTPSFSRIWDMLDKIKLDQRTQKGLKQRGVGTRLVLHDIHARDINRILGQQYEFDGTIATGGTTDYVSSKNTNSLRGKNLKVTFCQELTDQNAMFLMGRRASKNFHFKPRKKMTTQWQLDGGKRNRTRSVFTHCRFLLGVTHFIDFIGAQGSS